MRKPLRVPHLGLTSGVVRLEEAERHYVARVHRLGKGGELLLFDPESGTEANATLLDARNGECDVGEPRPGARLGFPGLTLFLGRPKAPALERVVRDAVAFSVGRIALVDSEHAVVKNASEGNPRRLREIALDEARQCERGDLPRLLGPTPFVTAVDETFAVGGGVQLLLDPRGAELALLDALPEPLSLAEPFALGLWVGPEGGFSEMERTELVRRGAIPVHLGPMVLRVATAVAAALAIVTAAAHRRSQ